MVTYLSIAFVLFLLAAILYGFGIVMPRPPAGDELQTEQCTLCRKRFPKPRLVERQIGDSRLLYFCSDCIRSLLNDAGLTS